jgi:glycerol-3-phosphate dehydrogenase
MADPTSAAILAASRGSHIVLDRSFLPRRDALIVPRTSDGRVLFAIPWHGHVLLGTTDVAVGDVPVHPRPTNAEIEFILDTAGRYLDRKPRREDVLSAWAGIRPLVRAIGQSTAKLSRDHLIRQDAERLLTITGGKWTTYRHMAEDCVNRAAGMAHLPCRQCRTRELRLHGYHADSASLGDLAEHGSDAEQIRMLMAADPTLALPLHPAVPGRAAEVVWAARFEMARTVEDVLARRMRILFLNTGAAIAAAPQAAKLLAHELGRDAAWERGQIESFNELAQAYRP